MQDTDTETTPGPVDARDLAPTLTVLIVSLVIAAIGVYQLCGFGLHSLDRRPHLFSDGLATGGVIVAVVTAGAAVGNLAWHLAAARRDTGGPAPSPDEAG
ncbi:hypothetical protein [Streptomyces sp. L2]|uniref:hypothetical protein n=1 Tax=Streptomyces sp. L2 TaxID=2162665 RepID=UPI0010118F4F|nr:hypothetical protein [Streptomyces sp. L2]